LSVCDLISKRKLKRGRKSCWGFQVSVQPICSSLLAYVERQGTESKHSKHKNEKTKQKISNGNKERKEKTKKQQTKDKKIT